MERDSAGRGDREAASTCDFIPYLPLGRRGLLAAVSKSQASPVAQE